MSDITITVIGAGVIGTSLGLALKQTEDPPKLVVHDKDPLHSRHAIKINAFDQSNWNLINACDNADIIVLAMPAGEIEETLKIIADDLKADAVITDTTPTKAEILRKANEILPDDVHFVGGNPIVSPVGTGPENADANLFKDHLYCLTPSPTVVPEAVKLMEDFVRLVGGTPFFLDPHEHDGLISAVNELPALLSVALVNSVSQPQTWQETRKLAGNNFAQVSAGATGETDSLAATFLSNKDNLTRQIDTLIGTLQQMRALLNDDNSEKLTAFIDTALVSRHNWFVDFENNQLNNLLAGNQSDSPIEKPNMFRDWFGFRKKR